MDTILMNSKNSKTSDPHRLLLNLTNKIKLINSSIITISITIISRCSISAL